MKSFFLPFIILISVLLTQKIVAQEVVIADNSAAVQAGKKLFNAKLATINLKFVEPGKKNAATEVGIQVFSLRFARQMQQSIYTFHQKSFHAHKTKRKNFFSNCKNFLTFQTGSALGRLTSQ